MIRAVAFCLVAAVAGPSVMAQPPATDVRLWDALRLLSTYQPGRSSTGALDLHLEVPAGGRQAGEWFNLAGESITLHQDLGPGVHEYRFGPRTVEPVDCPACPEPDVSMRMRVERSDCYAGDTGAWRGSISAEAPRVEGIWECVLVQADDDTPGPCRGEVGKR